MVTIIRNAVEKAFPSSTRIYILLTAIVILVPMIAVIRQQHRKLKFVQFRHDYMKEHYYKYKNETRATAIVRGSTEWELNLIVLYHFGESAECSWADNAVICTRGNKTKIITMETKHALLRAAIEKVFIPDRNKAKSIFHLLELEECPILSVYD